MSILGYGVVERGIDSMKVFRATPHRFEKFLHAEPFLINNSANWLIQHLNL